MQLKSLLLVFIFFTFTAPDKIVCGTLVEDDIEFPHVTTTYEPIVQRLKRIIYSNNWEFNFETAVKDAHETGTSEMKNIHDLTDYYDFLNYFVLWVPREDQKGTYVYRMLCTMYFVLDQKTVLPFQSPIVPWYPLPLTELSQWMVDFAREMGNFLYSSQSLTPKSLQSFRNVRAYNVTDDYIEPKGGWTSFNDFFARKFKDGNRPIDDPNNPSVIVSAADSTFDNWTNIDDGSIVTLKGLPWNITELLKDSKYANDFAGGVFMHAFLAPYDYHRQHAPVSGKVLEAKVILGQVYLEVVAVKNPADGTYSLKPIRKIDSDHFTVNAPNSAGYQFCQARGLILINSTIGMVAVLPIGMAQVSSVVLSTRIGDRVKKGQEISYFQLGGSDVVLVFQRKSKVSITAKSGQHYRVGKQIAVAHGPRFNT